MPKVDWRCKGQGQHQYKLKADEQTPIYHSPEPGPQLIYNDTAACVQCRYVCCRHVTSFTIVQVAMIAIRRVHCGTIEGERDVLNTSQQCTDPEDSTVCCLLQLIIIISKRVHTPTYAHTYVSTRTMFINLVTTEILASYSIHHGQEQ